MNPKSPIYPNSEAQARTRHDSWGSLTWLAGGAVGNASGLTLGRTVIKVGEQNPRHCHTTCEEALYLLRGRLRHTLGDESLTLEAGDTIVIPAGVFHNAVNIGDEDADMIVAFSSAARDFVLETP